MNKEEILQQIEFRKNELLHYVPTNFFRKNVEKGFEYFITKEVLSAAEKPDRIFSTEINGHTYRFIYQYLEWDSDFFKTPTYKLEFVLFDTINYTELTTAVAHFKEKIIKNDYVFIEIPSEDIFVIQALNEKSFRLVETRMTYYLDLNSFTADRYPVREATNEDIPNIKRVSSSMVNAYDRFHADVFMNKEKADSFLGVFAEESIKGFADYVMLPNQKGIPSDSFLTAKYYKNWWKKTDIKVSKMVLSAVSGDTNKGWYIKLISEMAHHLRYIGADYSIMHPASTNKAVIHTYEKLGCKLGKVTHILSAKNQK